MKPNDYNTVTSTAVIDDNASLQQFYHITNELSRIKRVKFTGKLDEADNIEWNFKYRGHALTLQYNIYGGVTLSPHNGKDVKVVNELVMKIKAGSNF
ncbi:MAG TPA: hypothetical protein PKM63_00835 [Panacibacter sp.]|nr:hypothetical protein [Panacibacter sp.]HNP42797.1 hypothetical protein [Panacibacter sp.]